MKRVIKTSVSFLLIVALLVVFLPDVRVNVQAQEKKFVDVVVSDAPLKSSAYKYTDIVARTYSGRVLTVVNEISNEYGHVWYEVAWENEPGDGNTAYIYSGNVKEHEHSYQNKEVEGVEYSYCECGDVYVKETSQVKFSNADTLVLGATATAGATSMVDGPLPVGDLVGLVLVAGTWCLLYSGAIPTELQEVTTDKDFSDYIKENGDTCSDTNFRIVVREGKELVKASDYCLTIPQAYVYARYCKGDVWTPDETGVVALACAKLNGDYIGPEVDKNQPSYYYHYHFLAEPTQTEEGQETTQGHKTVGGHVFYGKGVFTGCIPVGE